MSHSSHSRFSKMKRNRRLRDEREMSKVQTKEDSNKASHTASEVLRKSTGRTDTSNLPKLPRRFRNPNPPATENGTTSVLDNSIPVSESKPCNCCGLVWRE